MAQNEDSKDLDKAIAIVKGIESQAGSMDNVQAIEKYLSDMEKSLGILKQLRQDIQNDPKLKELAKQDPEKVMKDRGIPEELAKSFVQEDLREEGTFVCGCTGCCITSIHF